MRISKIIHTWFLILIFILLSCYKNISGVKNNINFNRIVLFAFLVSAFTSNLFNRFIKACISITSKYFDINTTKLSYKLGF